MYGALHRPPSRRAGSPGDACGQRAATVDADGYRAPRGADEPEVAGRRAGVAYERPPGVAPSADALADAGHAERREVSPERNSASDIALTRLRVSLE